VTISNPADPEKRIERHALVDPGPQRLRAGAAEALAEVAVVRRAASSGPRSVLRRR
jgi:hypothetical protein